MVRVWSLLSVAAAAAAADQGLTVDHLEQIHSKVDEDKDGKMSDDEMIEFIFRMREEQAELDDEDMEEVDTDKDKKISRKEWDVMVQQATKSMEEDEEDKHMVPGHVLLMNARFDAADGDKNGVIEGRELRLLANPAASMDPEGVMKLANAHLKVWDTNGDGKLSEKEFINGERRFDLHVASGGDHLRSVEDANEIAAIFKKLDRNKDKQLSVREFVRWTSGHHQAKQALTKFIKKVARKQADHLTLEELKASHELLKQFNLDKLNAKVDEDKDGKISDEEMIEFIFRMREEQAELETEDMEEVDLNKDGKVSREEWDKTVQRMQRDLEEDEDDKHMAPGQVILMNARFDAADTDNNDVIEGRELRFLVNPAASMDPEGVRSLARAHLKVWDRDGDGKLSEEEFIDGEQRFDLHTTSGGAHLQTMDESEISAVFKQLDRNKDKKLSVNEFLHWTSGHHQARQPLKKFLRKVKSRSGDQHLTLEELKASHDLLKESPLFEQFQNWVRHHKFAEL